MPDHRLDIDPAADDQQVLARIVAYYHDTLKATESARSYLTGLGLSHPALIDHFRLGYSDRSLGTKLPSKDGKAGRELRTRLERLGVFRESGHEHFRGSITVPITAADGTGPHLFHSHGLPTRPAPRSPEIAFRPLHRPGCGDHGNRFSTPRSRL